VPKLENVVYYCLSFTLTFDYNKDTVFIAYSRPYKYTSLILDILKAENALMEQDPDKYPEEKRAEPAKWDGETDITLNNQIWYNRKTMCLTLSGIPVPILTVTACRNSGKKLNKREGIFLTSRVHPGETNSSFVFMGMLEMLMKTNDPIAQYLRENFVFKMVPCLNPDGVIRGNYRSSFAGVDLNR
jgi:murein tripeptide amidase MpaA